MKGKYTSFLRFAYVKSYRAMLRAGIRHLLTWAPMANPRPGYSVIIGCTAPLAEMLSANLALFSRQDLRNLWRLIVVFDSPKQELTVPIEEHVRTEHPELPLSFTYYSGLEAKFLKAIGNGWIYSWLSWSKGIAACETRYAMLHDFDAMLIRPDIVEERFQAIQERQVEYLGARPYEGNGVIADDQLVTTFELMLDAAFVRRSFRPLDIFNHVCMYRGRTVDFDTFLFAQTRAGRRSVLPIAEDDMVHPSQMICQFTALLNRRGYVPPPGNNLLLIPYYLYLAGQPTVMAAAGAALNSTKGMSIPFFGRTMDLSRFAHAHAQWLAKQACRLEHALAGEVRSPVEDYLSAIQRFVERVPRDK